MRGGGERGKERKIDIGGYMCIRIEREREGWMDR